MRLVFLTAVLLLLTISVHSARGDLLVDDFNNQQVLRFSDSGALLGNFGSAQFHTGAGTPGAIGIDASNRVYIMNSSSGDIFRYDRFGNFLGLFGNIGADVPLGIDFDTAGNLWHRSGSVSLNRLIRLNTSGTKTGDFPTGLLG